MWVKAYVERAGFRAEVCHDGMAGLEKARRLNPDLILLDIVLPGISGSEVCRIIRKESDVPVIMLTAKGSREDRIDGLEDGADDYIVKPFDPDEVTARIRAVLRRTGKVPGAKISCGNISISESGEEVYIGREKVQLSHAQFSVLAVFMKHPGVVLSRRQIIEQAFGNEFEAYDRAVDTHIKRLRKLIHRDGLNPIQTVYGGGYKLICGRQ